MEVSDFWCVWGMGMLPVVFNIEAGNYYSKSTFIVTPINPPTTRVKISQNVDILPKVYLVHLKVKHCQTLYVVSTFTGKNESTVFDW